MTAAQGLRAFIPYALVGLALSSLVASFLLVVVFHYTVIGLVSMLPFGMFGGYVLGEAFMAGGVRGH